MKTWKSLSNRFLPLLMVLLGVTATQSALNANNDGRSAIDEVRKITQVLLGNRDVELRHIVANELMLPLSNYLQAHPRASRNTILRMAERLSNSLASKYGQNNKYRDFFVAVADNVRKKIRQSNGQGTGSRPASGATTSIQSNISLGTQRAQVDYFLKIPGVEGESAHGHTNQIDIESWSWGATNSGTFTVPPVPQSKADMQDLVVRVDIDKATPKLMEALTTGTHLEGPVVLTCRKAGSRGQAEYYIIKMKDVYITSYQTGGSSGDVLPTESVTLNYTGLEYTYVNKAGITKNVFRGTK